MVIQWENRFDEWRDKDKKQIEKGIASEDDARYEREIERRDAIYKLMMDSAIEEKGSTRALHAALGPTPETEMNFSKNSLSISF